MKLVGGGSVINGAAPSSLKRYLADVLLADTILADVLSADTILADVLFADTFLADP